MGTYGDLMKLNQRRQAKLTVAERSVTPPLPDLPTEKIPSPIKSSTSEVTKSRSTNVRKSRTSEIPMFRSYEVRKFDELRRLDIRITGKQKRFLDDLEEDIRQSMPEGDKDDPHSQRITKNSVIRILLEIARLAKLKIDASTFQNEADLLEAIYEELCHKLPNFRTPEVGK